MTQELATVEVPFRPVEILGAVAIDQIEILDVGAME